ncbi:hypothetical protein K1719_001978 [Acacia pycnantha]|nr:hypothetical protein K1719_001978 [Acacia pycnantha]
MEETEINGAATYLPEEIITNIFMRLPVKSVMRFRCVCKYWENLFKTPFFITYLKICRYVCLIASCNSEMSRRHPCSIPWSNVSCNGAIFAYGLKLGKEVLVSFDIATEVFTLIQWPPLSGDPSINLTVYEDKLALLITSTIGASSKVDLWVIEEDMGSSWERWNWIKKFTSDPYPREFIPWIIWRNEIVVSGTEIGVE